MQEWISDYELEYEWLTSHKAEAYEEEWRPIDSFSAFISYISKERIYEILSLGLPTNYKLEKLHNSFISEDDNTNFIARNRR